MEPHRRRHHPRGHDMGADEGGVQRGGGGVAWVPDVAWQQSAFSTSTDGRGKKVAAARGAVERLNEPGTQVEADLAVLPIGAGATASAETCRAHGKPRGKPADSSSQLSMCLAGLLGGGGRGPGQTGGRSPATSVDRETSRSPRLICWMGVGGRGPADVDLAVLLSHNKCPGDSFDGLSRACLQGPGRETHGKKGGTLSRCRVGQWAWGALHPLAKLPWGPLARRHRDGFCTVRRVHGPHHSPPPVDCELCHSPHYQPSQRCQARKAAREGERWMLGTCPLVVIHGGDVTSESVVLVVRTTRSGCPCFVGGIITTTTSAGGRPFVSRALPCPALACPGGFAGNRRINLAMLRKHSLPWVSARLTNHEGCALRDRLAAGEEASSSRVWPVCGPCPDRRARQSFGSTAWCRAVVGRRGK